MPRTKSAKDANSGKHSKGPLSFFDVTNIVIGAIVGSDIYIASALTAATVGPFSIVCWLIAGIFAAILAAVFAYCSVYVPKVGGSYAYLVAAFDRFFGFLAGWSMWIAEIVSLPVFTLVFVSYLMYFIKLNPVEQIVVKLAFVSFFTFINIVGIKRAARLNDFLTVIKLLPLFLMVVGGVILFIRKPEVLSNYTPFFTGGLGAVGPAVALIFWAYAGFELAPLPADEIKDANRTLPKALFTGMAIVILFYLTTNFVVYGAVKPADLAKSTTPLSLVGTAVLGTFGAIMMAVGALFSVSGSNESAMIGTGRLAYAMSVDGLFPKILSAVHSKYKTPYLSLIIQGIIAFVLSLFTGIRHLISFAVLNLAFSYLLTCLALLSFHRRQKKLFGQQVLPLLGILICLFLIIYTSLLDKLVGLGFILLGIPLYYFFSDRARGKKMNPSLAAETALFVRTIEEQDNFLAHFLRHVADLTRRRATIPRKASQH